MSTTIPEKSFTTAAPSVRPLFKPVVNATQSVRTKDQPKKPATTEPVTDK